MFLLIGRSEVCVRVAAVGQDLVGAAPCGVLRRPVRDPARGPGLRRRFFGIANFKFLTPLAC